ncbi:FAR1 DNA-binding domain protein [Medicago truncatula]|uniref:FAR1 DNA-binding domain protein n=1 Tax=Medicago truncatula TaxID=3880 RepID=A0A072UUH8_MEDTR|nr:FAR1 DNA-binding domain protein [Medicago truncatula]
MDLISTSSESGQLSVETSSLIHDSSQCYSPSNKESWKSLVFKTIKEIEDFYGNYAYNTGFSIRTMLKSKNNSQNKKSDKVHYVRYVCNKQPFKKGSLLNPNNRPTSDSPVVIDFVKVKEKPEERVGCKAGIYLKLDEVFNVYRDVTHCHPLHKPEHLCYLRSFREVNEVQGQLALINSKAGMSMRTSYEVMGQGVGGT